MHSLGEPGGSALRCAALRLSALTSLSVPCRWNSSATARDSEKYKQEDKSGRFRIDLRCSVRILECCPASSVAGLLAASAATALSAQCCQLMHVRPDPARPGQPQHHSAGRPLMACKQLVPAWRHGATVYSYFLRRKNINNQQRHVFILLVEYIFSFSRLLMSNIPATTWRVLSL